MGDKPKFLYRPNEYGDWYAKIGRAIKARKNAGFDTVKLRGRQKAVRIFRRKYKTRLRYLEWSKVYRAVYDTEFAHELSRDKTEKQADKHAMIRAEYAVVSKFPKKNKQLMSERTVRNAMRRLDDEDYMYDIFHDENDATVNKKE